ncbi:MAG: CHAD domain-containing protein [Kofleriaceae bacterium]
MSRPADAPATEPPAVVPAPHPEPDKLGPLGRSSLLDEGADLRGILVGEFAAAVGRAHDAAATLEADPHHAVHTYRRALRRARGVLGLVAGELPRAERRTIKKIIRDARRALSLSRDHVAAPAALSLLALGDAERATAEAVLATAREAAPATADTAQLLRDGADRVAAQSEALEAALPAELDWDTVADGLAASYRAARDAHARAKRSRRAFHAWRRRTKELALQLDVLADHAGDAVGVHRDAYAALSDDLGQVVDLILLREFVATHGHGQPADALDALHDAIDGHLEVRMKACRKGARELFERSGKKFARGIGKALRFDLAPVAAE